MARHTIYASRLRLHETIRSVVNRSGCQKYKNIDHSGLNQLESLLVKAYSRYINIDKRRKPGLKYLK